MKFFKRTKSPQPTDGRERDGRGPSAASSVELERRVAQRFSPGEGVDDGFVVLVSGPDLAESWEVHDLSTSGLSLHLDPEDPREFPREDLRVSFTLPNAEGPFEVAVRVAHDTVLRDVRRIGLSFDASRTPDLEHIQARILDHFVGRYRVRPDGYDGSPPNLPAR